MPILSHSRYAPFRRFRRVSLLDVIDIYRQRRALDRLDDHALQDIGLTREEARAEARRPIWDVSSR